MRRILKHIAKAIYRRKTLPIEYKTFAHTFWSKEHWEWYVRMLKLENTVIFKKKP